MGGVEMKMAYFALNKLQLSTPTKMKFDSDDVCKIEVQNGHFIGYYYFKNMEVDESYEGSEYDEMQEELNDEVLDTISWNIFFNI